MVDARVCNDEKAALAEEISLAENIIREAMSPADECRGYRAAMDKGESEEELARRMGVTVRHVQGRLRLARSEEHTSELQSLMRISYAVFCLKQKTKHQKQHRQSSIQNKHITQT